MAKYKNTLQKGSVRYVVFQEDGVWYAAGLEFNIVESGDTPREAMILLFEALSGYVESARKIKARPAILNQAVDQEYEKLWQGSHGKKPSFAKKIFTSGEFNIGQIFNSALMPA